MRTQKLFVSILMFSATTAGCAERPDTNSKSPEWVSCAGGEQCTAVYLPCHGWVAVASGHEADAERMYTKEEREALSVVECITAADAPQAAAVCRAGICAIETTGETTRTKP